uniref:catechol O-methyltransferase n=1 Tax=Dunaliella tertiolecta TaxID=3047 RepID=A0A7S3RAW3_DUNTE
MHTHTLLDVYYTCMGTQAQEQLCKSLLLSPCSWRASKTALSPGDDREARLLDHVVSTTPAGNPSAVVQAIDDYAWSKEWFMNVGDQKGKILDEAIHNASKSTQGPLNMLELGTYCAYSAIRTISHAPSGTHLYSIEVVDKTADIAEKMIAHAGLQQQITVLRGPLEDLLHQDLRSLPQFDAVFLDHDKRFYVSDLKLLMAANKLREGAVVVGDNLLIPGVPEYIEYMNSPEGKEAFDTVFHEAKLEYTWAPASWGFADQVGVSVYKGPTSMS